MERSVLAEPRHIRWASDLHSEYRSTYRWHEFKQQSQTDGAGIVKQPAKSPPNALPLFQGPTEPAMPRRKKYPGVAYKTNEIFDPAPADTRPRQAAFQRARSVQRNEPDRAGRRSKSEGPRQTRWTDTVEPKNTTALGDVAPANTEPVSLTLTTTEYRNQFAWPKEETPRKSISMGALKKAAVAEGSTEAEPLMNHADEHDGADKRYIEDYMAAGQRPQVHRKSTFRTALSAFISNGEDKTKDNNRKKMSYKSEYKKKFRPFSQYVYEASKGTFTKCRGVKMSEETREASERMLPAGGGERVGGDVVDASGGEDSASTLRAAGLQPLGRPEGDSWYREVLDLRKRAGEYKYRGWGTELAPEHITQLYNKQIELWYQVSRRSSLSALSLASTNHNSPFRALPRDEKDGKESKSHSPKKFRSFRSAPHQSIHAKLQENKERSQNTSPQKTRKKTGSSFDEGSAPDGVKESSFRSPRRRPRSADPAPVQSKHIPNGHEPQPRPAKPSGLALNKGGSSRVRTTSQSSRGGRSPSAPPKTGARGNGALVNGAIGATGATSRRSRSVSKVGIKLDDEVPSHRSASAKDHFFDDSPVVKSPPEPTRVKSPEQMNMRSPDPVNWTVPLDTGKTFTVTQNVKSDESVKRPSSGFRGGSVAEEVVRSAEIAPIHHQQMSPIRSLKKSESPTSLSKRTDKTPTTPISLTPIDETKALDMKAINGMNGNGVNSTQLTPETPTKDPVKEKDVLKKSTEATQVAPGVVDTTVVNESTSGLSASEVLDRARTRFDKFWGKKEEDNV